MKLSVVISAYNEEKMIEDCLKSVNDLADEIVFIDNSSSDQTAEIAKKFNVKIYKRENDPVMLNKNKNWGFLKASGDWIFSLDADERVTPELSKEIRAAVNSKSITSGYEIPRKNILFGKWIEHSLWWPDYNVRLFKKSKAKFPQKYVHEKIEVDGEVGQLQNPLLHYNYQSVSQYLRKLDNTYTESEVENFIKSGKSINWYDAIRWPLNDFLKTFFLQKGYKDGMHGLVLSIFQAFYAFVFFAKVWERKENFKDMTPDHFLTEVLREFQKAAKDIRYWIFETLMQENPAKKIYYKLRRKLK